MRYLVLEDFTPTSLNRLKGHWGAGHRLKKSDRQLVAHYAREQGLPEATGRRKVGVYVTLGPKQRAPDADNLFKSLLDALKQARLIVDDGPLHLELGPVEYSRGPRRRTVVALEDVP